jgi:hypothetical protein
VAATTVLQNSTLTSRARYPNLSIKRKDNYYKLAQTWSLCSSESQS